jgi:hypothetical protein
VRTQIVCPLENTNSKKEEKKMVTYGMGALILGAVLSVLAVLAVKSKDKRKALGWIGAFLLIPGLIAVMSPGTIPFLDGTIDMGSQVTQTVIPVTGGVVSGCAVEDTTVTLSALNKYTATATSGTHAYRVNNGPKRTVSDAGTFTASPGDSISILWENEATASNYFGKLDTVTVPCKGTATFSADLVQNGTFSLNAFNEEGNLMNSAGENETLGAGDTVSLSIEVSAENKKGFPNGGVLVLEVNKSDYDEEELYIELSGSQLRKVGTPESYSISSTDNIAITFEVSPLEGSSKRTGSIYLDVDDTNNPGEANDPKVTFIPKDYFINEDNGGAFEGPSVNDEDNSQTFGHSTVTTLNVD